MKKQITKKHPEGFIRINISTDGCGGRPYFSITADLCADSTFRDSKIHACGCLHDDILKSRPDLKPLVDIHLADLNGEPMHSIENGFYWLCGAAGIKTPYGPEQSPEVCFSYLCEHLRVKKEEGEKIMGQVTNAFIDGKAKLSGVSDAKKKEQGLFDAKVLFGKIVEEQRPRWKKEADAAIALLESL